MLPQSEERRADLRNVSVMEVIVAVILILMIVIYQKDGDLFKFANDKTVLEQELKLFNKENAILSDNNKILESELKDLRESNLSLEKQIAQLKGLLKNTELQLFAINKRYKILFDDLTLESKKFFEERLENETLKDTIAALKKRILFLEKDFSDKEKDVIEFQLEVSKLKSEILNLKSKLLSSAKQSSEISDLILENTMLINQVEQLRVDFDFFRKALTNKLKLKEKENKALKNSQNSKTRIAQLMSDIQLLNKQVESLEDKLKKVQQLNKESEKARIEITKENSSIMAQLEIAKKNLSKFEEGKGGIGPPMCRDIKNSPNYKQKGLATVSVKGPNFQFSLLGELRNRQEIIKIVPGANELVSKKLISKKEMQRYGNKILKWSQEFSPECRFFVYASGDLTAQNVKFLRGYFIVDYD